MEFYPDIHLFEMDGLHKNIGDRSFPHLVVVWALENISCVKSYLH